MKTNKTNYTVELFKILAACLVIFSHAFPIAANTYDPFSFITNGQTTGGGIAVAIFFTFSGFYITRSISKYDKTIPYFYARAKRIFPALWIVVVFTILLLGPILTTFTICDYFSSPLTWKYLLNGVLIPTHDLPGVFENNIYLPTVNGALWTLPVEFFCYVILWCVYKIKLIDKKRFLITLPIVAICVIGVSIIIDPSSILLTAVNLIISFYIGVLLCIYETELRKTPAIARWIIYIAAFICSIILNAGSYTLNIIIPLIVMEIVLSVNLKGNGLVKLGKYSYEVYLVGFPIQQTIVFLFGGSMNPYINAVLSIPLAIILGFAVSKLLSLLTILLKKKTKKKH